MEKITAIYIDDDINSVSEVGGIAPSSAQEILSDHPLIDVVLVPTGSLEDILQRINGITGDVYLVDLDLTQVQQDKTKSTFKGSTVADALRDRSPDTPIVLFTRQSILDDLSPERRRQILHQNQTFDTMILKDDIYDHDEEIQNEILTLVQGFRVLNDKSPKNITALFGVLNMTSDEEPHLREISPPLVDKTWISTGANRWIRHMLVDYAGILYDDIHAATLLGISLDSFHDERVQLILKKSEYDGSFPLPKHRKRWWKVRLLDAKQKFIFEQEEIEDPFTTTFGDAFEVAYGDKLKPALCIWDCEPIADWVCHILKQPVKLRHTLRYYPSNALPRAMDEPRVSFRAIRESESFDPAFLDKKGAELIHKIETMDDPCVK